jgi:hypothetical protein
VKQPVYFDIVLPGDPRRPGSGARSSATVRDGPAAWYLGDESAFRSHRDGYDSGSTALSEKTRQALRILYACGWISEVAWQPPHGMISRPSVTVWLSVFDPSEQQQADVVKALRNALDFDEPAVTVTRQVRR